MALERKKSSNFSKRETEMLVEEVESKRDVLFAKFSGSVTNESKRKLWEEIAMKLNGLNGGELRTGKMVKKKWQDMASIAKRKEAGRLREAMLTGGGISAAPPLSADEIKVVDVLGPVAVEGVVNGIDTADVKPLPVPVDGGKLKPEPPLSLRKRSNADELLLLEEKRLNVHEELLEVERKRLLVEEKRLAVEERRLAIEEQRLALKLCKEAGQAFSVVQLGSEVSLQVSVVFFSTFNV